MASLGRPGGNVTGLANLAAGQTMKGFEVLREAAPRASRVAVLTDLGSAVLTVKALLAEGDELPEGTRLVDAPFVEGAVAASEAYMYRKE